MKQKGYTLIELVIALVIIAILSTYAIGPLRGWLLKNRVANQTNLIQLDLSLARTEAISRAYPTMLVPRETWKSGWDIVIDKNNNGTMDEDEEIIRFTSFENQQIEVIDSDPNAPIIFTSLGSLKSGEERSLQIKHPELNRAKSIVIASAGSISVRRIVSDSN